MVKIIGEAITGQGHVGAVPEREGVPESSATARSSHEAAPGQTMEGSGAMSPDAEPGEMCPVPAAKSTIQRGLVPEWRPGAASGRGEELAGAEVEVGGEALEE
eukprot:8836138-Heterocapsa_arctica.AAC.1